MAAKEIPAGVKVISIVYYLGAAFGLIAGLMFFVGAGAVGVITLAFPVLAAVSSGLFILIGILFLALGILALFVGRGLWKAKPWARIIAIILSGISFATALLSFINGNVASNIANLIIHGAIGGYLAFNIKVKQVFSR